MSDNLYVAVCAAVAAGNDILRIYTDPAADFQIERKSDNSPLTVADKAAHKRIAEALRPTGIPILSEEGRHEPYGVRAGWELLWVVDPLDGTKEFIKRNGDFTVNIALVRSGTPVSGVIYVPVSRTLYFAEEGLGAYRLDDVENAGSPAFRQQLERARRLPLDAVHDTFRIVASASHMNEATAEYIERLKESHARTEIVSRGSSLKICMVAEGTADVYPRFAPTMEWDTAAGDAIARCAGRTVCCLDDGMPLVYNKPDLLNPCFVVKSSE